jgi:hypothetical protein
MTARKSAAYQRRHKHGRGVPLYDGVEDGPRRICVTLDADGFRRMAWLARKRGVPMNAVLADAVYAYVLPIAADADADTAHIKNDGAHIEIHPRSPSSNDDSPRGFVAENGQ